ncbi:MAG: hypothetical protein IVW52_04815 [Acidimicrobiales bacterium]|nr:hypothetical protein [Acidimicrobiales bacterium]
METPRRLTQEQAGYLPSGPFRCDTCIWFRGPRSCALVEGTIDPGGCCDGWEDRPGRNDHLFSAGPAFLPPIEQTLSAGGRVGGAMPDGAEATPMAAGPAVSRSARERSVDERIRCLVIGQQMGDNVADLSQLLDDLVAAPQTTVARDTNTLASAYVARIDNEFKVAMNRCGLSPSDPIVKRWIDFEDTWGGSRDVPEIRAALARVHDLLDMNQVDVERIGEPGTVPSRRPEVG